MKREIQNIDGAWERAINELYDAASEVDRLESLLQKAQDRKAKAESNVKRVKAKRDQLRGIARNLMSILARS